MTKPKEKEVTPALAQRVQRIKPSPTLAVSARADELIAAGKPIINLSVGEPDFDTPEHIKQAAIAAIQAGYTKYTAVDGIKKLKQAIINKFHNENHLTYQLDQILVSSGAKHSIFNFLAAVVDPGDEVIIPAPYWVSYPDMVKLMDGVPVIVEAGLNQQFKITPAQLAAAITNKTRVVILNSPSNPTGVAYTEADLKALGDVILKHPSILVLSDDIYEHHMWNHTPFKTIVNACPDLYNQCVVVNGVSKAYAMTGWRIGYAAGPAKILAAMKKAQSQSTSNASSIAQYAALAALEGDQTCVQQMTKVFKERHDFVYSELQKMPGVKCTPSDGTFYSFPCIEALLHKDPKITNDLEFADYLLSEANLALVPGSAFGAPGYIRICYTLSMADLREAMQRLNKAITKLNEA